MSRTALVALIALLVAGAAYAFWPDRAPVAERFVEGAMPAAFTLRSRGLEQQVAGTRVAVRGVDLALDRGKAGALWNALSSIVPQPGKVVDAVAADQLGGYGLGGDRELDTGALRLRWGSTGGTGYAWSSASRRLVVLPEGLAAALDGLAGRLDDGKLLPANLQADRLEAEGAVLVRQGATWSAEGHPERPSLSRRVNALLALTSAVPLTDLDAQPVMAVPVSARLAIAGTAVDGDPMEAMDGKRRAVALDIALHRELAGGGLIAVQGLPPQRLAAAAFRAWEDALAALRQDVLLTVDEAVPRGEITAIAVARAGAELFRLERREKPSGTIDHRWELVWPGGRDDAAADAFTRMLALLDDLRIRAPEAKGLGEVSPGATLVTIRWGRKGDAYRVCIDGRTALSEHHRGRLADDPARLLAELAPERWLDRRLMRRDAQRVAKLQRILADETPRREEVVARNEGGAWARTWPRAAGSRPVDAGAVESLVRVLAAAELGGLRFATAADRALLAEPEVEVDLRFAATAAAKQAIADTDVDETADQEWGMALRRVDGRWRGVDRDGLYGFSLDDEVVEALRQGLDGGAVFPLVPALVKRCEIRRGERLTTLTREGQAWLVAEDGDTRPADAQAVRRWFRTLAQLAAAGTRDERAVEPPVGEREGSVRVELPGLDGGTEAVTLTIARLGALPRVAAWTASDKPASRFPRGRVEIQRGDAEQALPAAAAFGAR